MEDKKVFFNCHGEICDMNGIFEIPIIWYWNNDLSTNNEILTPEYADTDKETKAYWNRYQQGEDRVCDGKMTSRL
jgi:hypothetical protein